MDERQFWNRFTLKILCIILFVIVSLSFSLYYIMNSQYQKTTIGALKDDAMVVYEYVDKALDYKSLFNFDTIEDEDSELYKMAHEKMEEIRRIANIRYLYTAKQRDDGEYIYVLDGLDTQAEDFRHIGDPIEAEILPKLKRCLDGEIIMSDSILITEWGIVYVTYFPVHGENGNVIGAIGMEFDCENLHNSLVNMKRFTTVIALILAVSFSSSAVWILTKSVRKAKNKLIEKDRLLVSAKEEALRSNNAKSVFLSHISHEIRTPLNAIVGMTAILKDLVSDSEKAQFSIKQILRSSNHLLNVLNNVLDMSKIESGKLELTEAPFSLLDACAEVSEIISQRCVEKSISFSNNIHEIDDVTVVGDKLRLNQVLLNLLSNAVKFTPEGGKVSCLIQKKDETVNAIRYKFEIEDNGIGMSKEQMSKLFIPFEQTRSDITAQYGGTGLGLSISQNLINSMGGKIEVESRLDKGSKFFFDLQMEKSGAVIDRHSPIVPDVKLTGKRILLVEDIEINRVIICETLSATGVLLDEATDGKKAVEMFGSKPAGYYDLILMDVQMPVMGGYEATKCIRAIDHSDAKTIPIVAMTANAYKEDIDQALDAGMNAHLAKPVDVDMLMETLAKFIAANDA